MKRYFLLIAIAIIGTQFSVLAQSASRLPEKSIVLPDNTRLRYIEQGNKKGIPVIMLHGFTDSWHSYELVVPYLVETAHLYIISQRGHGNSDRPVRGYRPDDFADDIAAFMQQLRIGPAVIVGHSMGATIAQNFAIRYPQLIRGLVLIAGFANFHNNPSLLDFSKVVHGLSDPIDPQFAKDFQQSTLTRPVPPAFFDTVVNESMKVPARVWQQVMSELMKVDYTRQLKSIKKPALIFWGDKDAFALRADQDMLREAIPGSILIIYEGTGHAVHWEEPGHFAWDLASFIHQLSNSKGNFLIVN
jgi:non-heme chloroperoxidase